MSKSSTLSEPPSETETHPFEVRDAGPADAALWDSLVDASPDAWIWHVRGMRDYVLAAAAERAPRDLSFFILRDGRPVALAPLIVERVSIGAYAGHDAAYYGGPLPWPCVIEEQPAAVETLALRELCERAKAAGAGRLRLQLSPPAPSPGLRGRFAAANRKLDFLGAENRSHLVTLGDQTLSSVRARYRRYQRKYSGEFDVRVVDGDAIDDGVEEAYFQLHVADAGGQFRSRESYTRMVDIARSGNGFVVIARHRESGEDAGALVILLAKGAGYDASVGIAPHYRQQHVSVLLKWAAIEALTERNAASYELGAKAELADWNAVPSVKNYDISFFKEGWARGVEKSVFVAETFLDRACLEAVAAERLEAVASRCGIDR